MNTVIKTAGVVALTEDLETVLLIKHTEKGTHKTYLYGIPGGRMEEGESEIACAIREFKEEVGLEISDKDELKELPKTYTGKNERKDGTRIYTLTAFLYVLPMGVQVKESEEGEVHMVKVKDVHKLPLLPNALEMVMDAKSTLLKLR